MAWQEGEHYIVIIKPFSFCVNWQQTLQGFALLVLFLFLFVLFAFAFPHAYSSKISDVSFLLIDRESIGHQVYPATDIAVCYHLQLHPSTRVTYALCTTYLSSIDRFAHLLNHGVELFF